jgi:hypothetical protein
MITIDLESVSFRVRVRVVILDVSRVWDLGR